MDDVAVIDGLETQERTGSAPKGGLTFDKFSRYCDEIRNEPLWRQEADKVCDYYDNNQLPKDVLNDLDDRGMGPLITNLIAPAINTVLGMEAKTRTDWHVVADDDRSQEVADALNVKLHEAERQTRADRAVSDAYAGQVKAGLSWVEVSRHHDPFKPTPYRVAAVHRREMWWQWTAREYDLHDSAYVIRRRWFDKDTVKTYFPKSAEMIEAASGAWPSFWLERIPANPDLMQAFDQERGWAWEDYEWRDTARSRVCLFECWYRNVVRGYVLKLGHRTVELDMKNQVHVAAVGSGRVRPIPAIFSRLSKSLWLGPHKLADMPHASNRLPYVPFWGYREDLTGAPYGMIRAMISPQDEINARRQKLMWLLSAKRLTIDSDALDQKVNTLADVLSELNRADAAVVTNPNRKNKDAVQVDNNLQLSNQQFEIMQEAKESLRQAGGVYQPNFDKQGNAESGIAVENLVEMGSTTLAEINDNYNFGRRQVGELLLEEIRDDMAGQPVTVMVGESAKKKMISLNRPMRDEQSRLPMLENDTERSPVRLELEDVPSTPTFRRQQFRMISDMMKGLPPQLQAIIAPIWMEASDMPKRKEAVAAIRKALGISEDPDDPNQQITPEQVQQMIEEAVQQALQQSGVDLKNRELDIKEKEVDARVGDSAAKTDANALATDAKAAQADAQTRATLDANDRDNASHALELVAQVEQLGQDVVGMKEVVEQGQKQTQERTAQAGAEVSDKLTTQLKEVSKSVDKLQRQVEQQSRDKGPDPLTKQLMKQMDTMQRELLAMGRKKPEKTAPAAPSVVFETGAIQVNTGGGSKSVTLKGPGGKEYVGEIKPDAKGKD